MAETETENKVVVVALSLREIHGLHFSGFSSLWILASVCFLFLPKLPGEALGASLLCLHAFMCQASSGSQEPLATAAVASRLCAQGVQCRAGLLVQLVLLDQGPGPGGVAGVLPDPSWTMSSSLFC